MKTATKMIEMKVETIIIDTKIVSVNQVLVTIRLNPVAKIKQNAISDTVFNVQSTWRHCLGIYTLYIYIYIYYILVTLLQMCFDIFLPSFPFIIYSSQSPQSPYSPL